MSQKVEVKFFKLDKEAQIPKFASEGAAGFDFHALHTCKIPAKSSEFIATGLCVELPSGYELQVRSRSGLALKHNVIVLNSPGTIDSDYRGEIKIILMNFSTSEFIVNKGDRIAQGVVNKLPKVEIIESNLDSISSTKRGASGFGSTGV